MRRLFLIGVVYTALFGIGYAGALLDDKPGTTEVVHAAPCVGNFSVNVANSCGSSGWYVVASVMHCPASVPTGVRADVYDGGGNLLESFPLTYTGSGIWAANGTCRNPQTAATVTFTALGGGQIDQATGSAVDGGCGTC
jgi:hypothetical protein